LGPGADHRRMARIAEAWDRSTAPGATSRSTISSASVRPQRLRLACRSGAQLIPILVMAGPVLAMHVFGQIYSIHFERDPRAKKSEVEGEIESQIESQEVQEGQASSAAQAAEGCCQHSGAGGCCNGSSRLRRQA